MGIVSSKCPEGKELDAGLCYSPCPANMKGVGPVCWGVCPSNFTDALVACQKKSHVQRPHSLQCASNQTEDAGLCYNKCDDDYTGHATRCYKNCPSGFHDLTWSCGKPATYGRGFGHAKESDCLSSKQGREYGCEKWGLLWYPKCKEGFHNAACCVCSPDCPEGWKDGGAICWKPSYNRGVGKVPHSCPDGQTRQGLFCYDNCQPGFKLIGGTCWSDPCPQGFRDDGLDCFKPSKGRGVGSIPAYNVDWRRVLLYVLLIVLAVAILMRILFI